MDTKTLIMADLATLQSFIDENVVKQRVRESFSKFDNVLVGVKDIARFHGVNERTVTNYVRDGLIVPEVKVKDTDHARFRLSYALQLDFRELQRKLRAKRKADFESFTQK